MMWEIFHHLQLKNTTLLRIRNHWFDWMNEKLTSLRIRNAPNHISGKFPHIIYCLWTSESQKLCDFSHTLRLRNFELSKCKREIRVFYSPIIRKLWIGFYMGNKKILCELRILSGIGEWAWIFRSWCYIYRTLMHSQKLCEQSPFSCGMGRLMSVVYQNWYGKFLSCICGFCGMGE